ncbi:MAG TPA: sodium:solute symporter family protein [Burkholderiales bacterium]|nr:sodium:solute symporter family protein [Burkholderiales bacterium]
MSSNLFWFVAIYLAVSITIGLVAALRVHSASDYITAGRRLPVYVVFAAVFATWFGAETVLGISATFVREGAAGLISDPFGASLCLVLVGLFFARPLYRMGLLTIGDFYRQRYDRPVELIASVCIALSYLGWVSAQVTALGLVFNVLSDGAISREWGMVIGASVVLVYTLFGGMWSVAVTTFVQMIVIVLGLIYIAWLVSGMTGGVAPVLSHAAAAGKLDLLPKVTPADLIGFVAALATMGLGSIPQQDVFQRVNASRTENTAVYGTILGGAAYFLFAAVPLFLVYAATLVDPKLVSDLLEKDSQLILPTFIVTHLPLGAQIVFYGALLSVIMSTASGTLLAPSVTIAENVLKGQFRTLTDRQFLWLTRAVVVCFALLVTAYSLYTEATIHKMVENAYKITLVAAFVPLAAGVYWRRATRQGALAASLGGLVTWIAMEIAWADAMVPPQFAGLLAAIAGMVAGSLLPQRYGARA